MKVYGPILFALIAAIGNAMFAAGQKKSIAFDNSLVFIVIAGSICVFLTAIIAPLLGETAYYQNIRLNWQWSILSGVGLFLTYLGFNLLYSKYGASNYVLYAVISILTTAIIVGAIIFKETLNTYHWLAFITALLTIVLFSIGNKQ